VRQVGHLQELHQDAGSTKHKSEFPCCLNIHNKLVGVVFFFYTRWHM